jgi:3-oxoacyl-[acyl-carrier-protein] synthase-3
MFIHGVGVAFPERSLSNADRAALGIKLSQEQQNTAQRCGVVAQSISLPVEYIKATGNVDVLEAWKVATDTPTTLGVRAAREALAKAGITIDSVGLLVADTATPHQTCPSEAQRIAGEFGVKVPAYDIVGGIGAIPHYFSMFSSWREERLPDYSLCISTNTPSQHVCFNNDPLAASVFGDSAIAILFSRRHSSAVRVVDAHVVHESKSRTPVVVEGQIRCVPEALLARQELASFISSELERIKSRGFTIGSSTTVIPPQLYASEAAEILKDFGIAGDRVVSSVGSRGFSIGSSYGVALAQSWGALLDGGSVVMLHCGDGMRGSVVLGPS